MGRVLALALTFCFAFCALSWPEAPQMRMCSFKDKVVLPEGWELKADEADSFLIASKTGRESLSIVTSDLGPEFPAQAAVEFYRAAAQKEKEAGLVEAYEDLALGKCAGLLKIESAAAVKDGRRRMIFEGYVGMFTALAYFADKEGKERRDFTYDSVVMVYVVASAPAGDFEACRERLLTLLKSLKLEY